jgi:hypothetical protein
MAFYPCSNHHGPYRGPSSAAYPAIVDGLSSDRRHLRMDRECFGDYLRHVAERLYEVRFEDGEHDEAATGPKDECAFCGSVQTELGCFVTAYPQHEKERQFHGRCCRECMPAAKAELLLS